jgi:hypothetical protein
VPVGVTVTSRTTFNHEGVFNPGITIINDSKVKATGTWEFDFQGKKAAGKVDLASDASEALDLKVDLGLKADSPIRQKLPLGLRIDLGGQKYDFSRQIEIVRNLGLKQLIPLSAADGKETAAKLQFDADSQKFFVTCELNGIDLIDDGGQAFEATLHLDARRYGQRLTPGATAAIRIHGKRTCEQKTLGQIRWRDAGFFLHYLRPHFKVFIPALIALALTGG